MAKEFKFPDQKALDDVIKSYKDSVDLQFTAARFLGVYSIFSKKRFLFTKGEELTIFVKHDEGKFSKWPVKVIKSTTLPRYLRNIYEADGAVKLASDTWAKAEDKSITATESTFTTLVRLVAPGTSIGNGNAADALYDDSAKYYWLVGTLNPSSGAGVQIANVNKTIFEVCKQAAVYLEDGKQPGFIKKLHELFGTTAELQMAYEFGCGKEFLEFDSFVTRFPVVAIERPEDEKELDADAQLETRVRLQAEKIQKGFLDKERAVVKSAHTLARLKRTTGLDAPIFATKAGAGKLSGYISRASRIENDLRKNRTRLNGSTRHFRSPRPLPTLHARQLPSEESKR